MLQTLFFLSCHSSSFQECHNVKCVRMVVVVVVGGQVAAGPFVMRQTKALPVLSLKMLGGGAVLWARKPKDGVLKANYRKERELRPPLSLSLRCLDMLTKTRPLSAFELINEE